MLVPLIFVGLLGAPPHGIDIAPVGGTSSPVARDALGQALVREALRQTLSDGRMRLRVESILDADPSTFHLVIVLKSARGTLISERSADVACLADSKVVGRAFVAELLAPFVASPVAAASDASASSGTRADSGGPSIPDSASGASCTARVTGHSGTVVVLPASIDGTVACGVTVTTTDGTITVLLMGPVERRE